MANYGRDQMKKDNNTTKGLCTALGVGVFAAIVGGLTSSNDKKKQEQALAQQRAARQKEIEECNQKISDIDSEIADLRSQFMGGFLNSDRIEQLQSRRRDLVAKRNELMGS